MHTYDEDGASDWDVIEGRDALERQVLRSHVCTRMENDFGLASLNARDWMQGVAGFLNEQEW